MSKQTRVKMVIGVMFIFICSGAALAQNPDIESAAKDELSFYEMEQEELISVATKTPMRMSQAPSIVSVITEEDIRNSGAKTIEEVLRQAAGFYLQGYATFPDILATIRGIGLIANPGVKIMVNGHSMENLGDDNFGVLVSFPVDLIKRIEIIRGPGSALYGNEAMNGVINIIAKDETSPSLLSAAYGSFGVYQGSAQVSYSKNDMSLYVFGNTSGGSGDSKLIEKDAASVQFPPGYSSAPGQTNEEYRFQTLFMTMAYKDFRVTGFYKTSRAEPPTGPIGALTKENDIHFDTAFVELNYNLLLNPKAKLTARTYADYNRSDFLYEFYSEKTTGFSSVFKNFPENEGLLLNYDNKTCKFGAELMGNATVSDSLEMVAGIQIDYLGLFETQTVTNANSSGKPLTLNGVTYLPMEYLGGMIEPYDTMEEGNRAVYSGYIQGTWNLITAFPTLDKIGNNLTITAGLRYDYHDDVGETINPRMGLVYAPNSRFFFKFLYGEAFRAPTFGQMYIKNSFSNIQNPDLKPELVNTSEILAGINITDRITATLDFFRVRKEDAILSYKGRYENRGQVESQGIEGEIRLSIDKTKYGYVNLTIQKAEDTSHERIINTGGTVYEQENYNIGMYPKIMANLGFNCDISKNINTNISVNYAGDIDRIGKMQFTSDKTDPDGAIEKSDKRDPVSSRTIVNLSLRFGNFDFAKGWEFQITGYNLFNSNHIDPEKNGYLENDYPRWDRHFLGKLTYIFQ